MAISLCSVETSVARLILALSMVTGFSFAFFFATLNVFLAHTSARGRCPCFCLTTKVNICLGTVLDHDQHTDQYDNKIFHYCFSENRNKNWNLC